MWVLTMPEVMTPTSCTLPCHMWAISGFRHGENSYREIRTCLCWNWGSRVVIRWAEAQPATVKSATARQRKKESVLQCLLFGAVTCACCQCVSNGVGQKHNSQAGLDMTSRNSHLAVTLLRMQLKDHEEKKGILTTGDDSFVNVLQLRVWSH